MLAHRGEGGSEHLRHGRQVDYLCVNHVHEPEEGIALACADVKCFAAFPLRCLPVLLNRDQKQHQLSVLDLS